VAGERERAAGEAEASEQRRGRSERAAARPKRASGGEAEASERRRPASSGASGALLGPARGGGGGASARVHRRARRGARQGSGPATNLAWARPSAPLRPWRGPRASGAPARAHPRAMLASAPAGVQHRAALRRSSALALAQPDSRLAQAAPTAAPGQGPRAGRCSAALRPGLGPRASQRRLCPGSARGGDERQAALTSRARPASERRRFPGFTPLERRLGPARLSASLQRWRRERRAPPCCAGQWRANDERRLCPGLAPALPAPRPWLGPRSALAWPAKASEAAPLPGWPKRASSGAAADAGPAAATAALAWPPLCPGLARGGGASARGSARERAAAPRPGAGLLGRLGPGLAPALPWPGPRASSGASAEA